METKSSLRRIVWSLVYVILAFGALRLVSGQESSQTWGPHQRQRSVVKKPWHIEPVQIVAVKNKKKANIEIGKAFDDDDDWLDGFTVTVKNNYDKVVTAMNLEMVFRREPGDTRPPAAQGLFFGPSPMSLDYLARDVSKVIKPGQTADIDLTQDDYESLKDLLRQAGYPNGAKQVELQIREVGFEDGSVLFVGTFFLQDPLYPNDPTKKIRPNKKHHHPQYLNRRSTRVSFTSSHSSTIQSECFDILSSSPYGRW